MDTLEWNLDWYTWKDKTNFLIGQIKTNHVIPNVIGWKWQCVLPNTYKLNWMNILDQG